MPRSVDVAILGAGTAGLGARREVQKAGKSVLMIDPGPLGTTCARVGCMPSKLLIAAANAAQAARSVDLFGVRVGEVTVDGKAVMARVQRERDRFVGFVDKVTDEAFDEGELLKGRAQITDPNTLSVGDETVRFERLVIATGSSPFTPPPFRGLEAVTLTSDEIFELPDLPESVLVIGLGVIGLELGQALHRLGVRVTLLGVGGGVGPLSDPEVLAAAKTALMAELDLHPDYTLTKVEAVDGGVRMQFTDAHGVARDERYERILMAAGRRPNLRGLGLESMGFEPNDEGVYDIDPATLQLGDAPVFVAGDANDLHPLLHEASDDGRHAGQNAARFPDVRALQRRTSLGVVFSDPQMGVVGMPYSQLATCDAAVGAVDFADQGRARVQGQNVGKVRIYGCIADGRLLGAELFGPGVEHLSHLLAWAIQANLTVEQALAMPFYHPVVEEGLRTALRDLNRALRRGAPINCRVSELGVGS